MMLLAVLQSCLTEIFVWVSGMVCEGITNAINLKMLNGQIKLSRNHSIDSLFKSLSLVLQSQIFTDSSLALQQSQMVTCKVKRSRGPICMTLVDDRPWLSQKISFPSGVLVCCSAPRYQPFSL